MSTADLAQSELVVAEDGSIPADQLARLGLAPGAHLRVVETPTTDHPVPLAGTLPHLPDLDWTDFARGSNLARRDLDPT